MPAELGALLALAGMAALIAWPALDAWRRRAASREAIQLAATLRQFASVAREAHSPVPLDAALCARLTRLKAGVPEVAAVLLAPQLPRLPREDLAAAAERLALRLTRRVAFEHKMLARSSSGLRRGAMAAAVPPAVLFALAVAGIELPFGGVLALLFFEALGCWLLWRVARVGI